MHDYFKIQADVTKGIDFDSQLLKIDEILSAIDTDVPNQEQIELFGSLRAEVLFHLEKYHDALDQLKSLFDKSPVLRSSYARRIGDVYLKINRQEDAISLLETRLREETDVTFKLNILNWFARNILNPSVSVTDFQVHIGQTSAELGIKIPENMDAREAVRFLKQGSTNFANSDVNTLINDGRYIDAVEAWRHMSDASNDGRVTRRREEADLFSNGDYVFSYTP